MANKQNAVHGRPLLVIIRRKVNLAEMRQGYITYLLESNLIVFLTLHFIHLTVSNSDFGRHGLFDNIYACAHLWLICRH